MLVYEEKMFREKPYTQCFECIQGNRLKCKKCMNTIVEDVLRHKQTIHNTSLRTSHQEHPRKPKKLIRRESAAELQVRSCYGLWMDQVLTRRTKERNVLNATLGCWPHKKGGAHKKMARP